MKQGITAYVLWGLFPLYFALLADSSAFEILGHRIIWAAVFMATVVAIQRRWHEIRSCTRSDWVRIALAGILVSANWFVYVWAVNAGHVAEAALGYFINPLLSVVLGVVFLRERLRTLQTLAVLLAAIAVLTLTVFEGRFPFIAISLAVSFGFYGLVKKGIRLSSGSSVAAETLVVAPIALIYLVTIEIQGHGTFLNAGVGHTLLLIGAGIATAVPLIFFGQATRMLRLSTIGILQYITPTMQMLLAVLVFREHLSPERLLAFVLIWIAVGVYIADIFMQRRRLSQSRAPQRR